MLYKNFILNSNTRLYSVQNVQTGSEAYPSSCPMVTGGSFPEDKATV
jgi:hypothetical protein